MQPRIRFSPVLAVSALIASFAACSVWAQTESSTRVVRLSFTEGQVSVQRPDVQSWAEAPINTPLQQGFKLSTSENSFAEIQFEDGSTVRLGEGSLLDLTTLASASEGSPINRVDLHEGYATFHALASRVSESLEVDTPYGTVTSRGGTKFRVDLDQGAQRVEVFTGSVQVQSNLGTTAVGKGSTLLLQPGSDQPVSLSQGVTKDDWDYWVDNREAHLDMPSAGPTVDVYDDGGVTAYGWSDLAQYGSWSDVPGEGYGWAPTTVAAGWSPYSAGEWCWYPGSGYTWIASEPWGWLPYHYGTWEFLPGRRFDWFPGNLRTWSPAQVTWFNGPGWIGWAPRHQKDTATVCNINCGGGVMSTSAFRNGGSLRPDAMLPLNPTMGQPTSAPAVAPTSTAWLPGPVISNRPGMPLHSSIVYDPQEHSYINSGRTFTTAPPATSQPVTPANTVHVTNPEIIQPVPVGDRDELGRTNETPNYGQPNAARGSTSPRWASSTPHSPANNYAAPPGHGFTGSRSAPSSPPAGGGVWQSVSPGGGGGHTGATAGGGGGSGARH